MVKRFIHAGRTLFVTKYYTIKISDNVMQSYAGINLVCAMTEVAVNPNYIDNQILGQLVTRLTVSKETLKDHPTVRALRNFYWRMGIDPTKTRPSIEALARRSIVGRSIPKVNNVVDVGNVASIETLVPIGLYDANKIVGEVTLRLAKTNEEFTDISNEKHILHDKEIVLSDNKGIMHVFPYRDAYRTRVKEDTTKVLIVGCGVPGMEQGLTKTAVDRTIELIKMVGA